MAKVACGSFAAFKTLGITVPYTWISVLNHQCFDTTWHFEVPEVKQQRRARNVFSESPNLRIFSLVLPETSFHGADDSSFLGKDPVIFLVTALAGVLHLRVRRWSP